MKPGERSPFQPDDELSPPAADEKSDQKPDQKPTEERREEGRGTSPAPAAQGVQPATPAVADLTGIQTRLLEVPLPAGNYSDLSNDGKRLYFMSRDVSSTTRPPPENTGDRQQEPET